MLTNLFAVVGFAVVAYVGWLLLNAFKPEAAEKVKAILKSVLTSWKGKG